MMKMRRVAAILLVFVFGFPLLAPALFADSTSNLPACCRRDGKHHCGMAQDMAETPSSGLAIGALHVKCPCFPNGGALLPHSDAALPRASAAAAVSIAVQIAGARRAEAGYRVSLDRSHQKRGPPSPLS